MQLPLPWSKIFPRSFQLPYLHGFKADLHGASGKKKKKKANTPVFGDLAFDSLGDGVCQVTTSLSLDVLLRTRWAGGGQLPSLLYP